MIKVVAGYSTSQSHVLSADTFVRWIQSSRIHTVLKKQIRSLNGSIFDTLP